MNEIEEILLKNKVIPVIVAEDTSDILILGETFLKNGIKVIEITLRTREAFELILKLSKKLPELLVGAGTVLSPDLAVKAKDYGARFLVSPGSTDQLILECQRIKLPFLPGASSVSEMMNLKDKGFKYIKFFPANYSGGIEFIKSIGSVLPNLCFCPTGGVNQNNVKKWLELQNVTSVGGTWIAPLKLIKEKKWKKIGENAKKASQL